MNECSTNAGTRKRGLVRAGLALVLALVVNVSLLAALNYLNVASLTENAPRSQQVSALVILSDVSGPEIHAYKPSDAQTQSTNLAPVTNSAHTDPSDPELASLDIQPLNVGMSLPLQAYGYAPSVRVADGVSGPGEEGPRAIHAPRPVYPAAALRRGSEGSVSVRLLIDEEGKVSTVEIESHEGSDLFIDSVRKALKTWRFEPAKSETGDRSSWVTREFVFVVEEAE